MTLGDVELVEWDDGNSEHLARHRVGYGDVVDVIETAAVVIPGRSRAEGRWKVVGYTRGGRWLTIVCAYDEVRRSLRPITGWDTTDADVSKYLT
jgi:uncharacterized DUF497 family protein